MTPAIRLPLTEAIEALAETVSARDAARLDRPQEPAVDCQASAPAPSVARRIKGLAGDITKMEGSISPRIAANEDRIHRVPPLVFDAEQDGEGVGFVIVNWDEARAFRRRRSTLLLTA